MKKIFTLFLIIAMLGTASAQYDQKDKRDYDNRNDVVLNDYGHKPGRDHDGFRSTYYFTAREKDMQIAQINREYNYKIQSVRNRFFMSWHQKKRQINFLEEQRNREIRIVMAKFYDKRNLFNKPGRKHRSDW